MPSGFLSLEVFEGSARATPRRPSCVGSPDSLHQLGRAGSIAPGLELLHFNAKDLVVRGMGSKAECIPGQPRIGGRGRASSQLRVLSAWRPLREWENLTVRRLGIRGAAEIREIKLEGCRKGLLRGGEQLPAQQVPSGRAWAGTRGGKEAQGTVDATVCRAAGGVRVPRKQ